MSLDHPAFAPYRSLIDTLQLVRAIPSLDALNAQAAALGTCNAGGLPVRFFAPDRRLSARDYETHILQTGQVPTRAGNWHDVLNALVWLRFPRFKAALNAAHGVAIVAETSTIRGRRRDALTVLDESGVWVISRDPALPRLLANRPWQELFWDARPHVKADMRFVVVGHALLEKALAPFPLMTGKCLTLLSDSLDPDAADALGPRWNSAGSKHRASSPRCRRRSTTPSAPRCSTWCCSAATRRVTWPQWLLAIGFVPCVVGVMVATVTQGSPAGRYVMMSGLVPIAAGGFGVLVQRLRTRQKR